MKWIDLPDIYDWTYSKKICDGIGHEAEHNVSKMLDTETDFESYSYLDQEYLFLFFRNFVSPQDTIKLSQ